MKVILLEDVYKQGVAGDVVEVAPGYARNYLIPQGLAVKATPGMLKAFENLSKKAEVRRAEREEKFQVVAEKIEELTLYFPVRASERGKLYGSVTTEQIAEVLYDEIGLEIDKRRIGEGALRELGEFDVVVRLDTGLAPTVKVIVHRDDVDPLAEEEAISEAEEIEAELQEGFEDYEGYEDYEDYDAVPAAVDLDEFEEEPVLVEEDDE